MRCMVAILILVSGLAPAARADELAAVRQLAAAGDTRAQFALGSLYRDGRGVVQDYNEMLRWWRLSAAGGDVDAQFALGDIFSGGYAFDRNLVRAYMWFDILAARAAGRYIGEIAASNRDAIEPVMSAADIEAGRQLSAAWQAQHAP